MNFYKAVSRDLTSSLDRITLERLFLTRMYSVFESFEDNAAQE